MREADFPVLGRLPQRASAAPRVSAAQQASSSASPPAQTGGASDAVKAAHRVCTGLSCRRQLHGSVCRGIVNVMLVEGQIQLMLNSGMRATRPDIHVHSLCLRVHKWLFSSPTGGMYCVCVG